MRRQTSGSNKGLQSVTYGARCVVIGKLPSVRCSETASRVRLVHSLRRHVNEASSFATPSQSAGVVASCLLRCVRASIHPRCHSRKAEGNPVSKWPRLRMSTNAVLANVHKHKLKRGTQVRLLDSQIRNEDHYVVALATSWPPTRWHTSAAKGTRLRSLDTRSVPRARVACWQVPSVACAWSSLTHACSTSKKGDAPLRLICFVFPLPGESPVVA